MERPVRLTSYVRSKFVFLREHGFPVQERDVVQTVRHPERVMRARLGRWVAQRALDERHLLRVVYEDVRQVGVVITFYPARRSRYESAHEV